jgi:uncharacterized tellurite resistance protein B-like protein
MPVFERVRALLQRRPPLALDEAGHPADLELQVATVALLLDVAYGNHRFSATEREAILLGVEREFGVSEADALALIDRAERTLVGDDVASVATQIAERYTLEQRKRIAALIWNVVYADQAVDREEEEIANQVMALAGLTSEQAEEARSRAFVWFSGTWRDETEPDLESRVRRLEDLEAIKQLKAIYCFRIDAREIDALMERFTEDAVWDGGPMGRFEGRDAIGRFLRELPQQLSFSLHWVMNPLIEIDGDRARGRWYLVEPLTSANGERAILGAGRYEERYVREGRVWKFCEIHLIPLFWTPYEEGWAKRPSVLEREPDEG